MSDFARAAIRLIRDQAVKVRGTRDFEVVELAAYLYAVGCQLRVTDRSARLRRRPSPGAPAASIAEMLDRLAGLPDDLSALEFYWTLIDALVLIENVLCRRKSDADAMPQSTVLEEIPIGDGSKRALGGEVLHWIWPRPVLNKEREARYQPARRRAPDPDPHPGTYLDRLCLYWHSDRQLPRLSRLNPVDRIVPLIRESGRDAREKGSFRIALCPLVGEFHPLFEVWPKDYLFRAADPGMAGAEALAKHLETLIDAAVEEGVHLLVLPELMIDEPARRALTALLRRERRALPPYGVVAGSLHLLDCGYDQPCANESVLLDGVGRRLVDHRKRGRFRFSSSFLEVKEYFTRVHPAPASEIFEDLEDGSELHFLETTLGRLALLICADAIAKDTQGYLPVIQRLRPDLLLVVAMSPKTRRFESFFEDMAGHWVGTVFVNAHCICRFGDEDEPPLLAYFDLAFHERREDPPTRAAWRYGKEPECLGRHPTNPAQETGVSLWRRGEEPLGLLLDLGAHLQKGKENG